MDALIAKEIDHHSIGTANCKKKTNLSNDDLQIEDHIFNKLQKKLLDLNGSLILNYFSVTFTEVIVGERRTTCHTEPFNKTTNMFCETSKFVETSNYCIACGSVSGFALISGRGTTRRRLKMCLSFCSSMSSTSYLFVAALNCTTSANIQFSSSSVIFTKAATISPTFIVLITDTFFFNLVHKTVQRFQTFLKDQ
uniref:Uncharacterized protein n=1 Tax=Timema bartmani TaxID=61472 RepID=A0A7R9I028_9NEOP|nr:unnamed protein product [Timema bartmani]